MVSLSAPAVTGTYMYRYWYSPAPVYMYYQW